MTYVAKETFNQVEELGSEDGTEDTTIATQFQLQQDEYQENVDFVNGNHTVFIQDGQYMIPLPQHTALLLQDDPNDCDQYIVDNTTDDFQEEIEQQPIIYYTEEFADGIQMLTEDLDQSQMIHFNEPVDEGTEMEQEDKYIDEFVVEEPQETDGDTTTDCDNIIIASEIDHIQLQQQPECQYTVLNGKLHLQTFDIVDVIPTDKLKSESQLPAFQQDNSVISAKGKGNLNQIVGRNLLTGQTVTLDGYFDKIKRRSATANEQKHKNGHRNQKGAKMRNLNLKSIINKKLMIGTMSNSKRLVGKILQVHLPSEVISTSETCENVPEEEKVQKLDSTDRKDTEAQESSSPYILIKKHIVSRENFDYDIGKVLSGLMDLESIQKKLQNRNLVVKLVKKGYDHNKDSYNRTVSYVYGHMELTNVEDGSSDEKKWEFVLHNNNNNLEIANTSDTDADNSTPPDNEEDQNHPDSQPESTKDLKDTEEEVSIEMGDEWNEHNETISLTISVTVDKNGQKSTKVNLNPVQSNCYCNLCNKTFKNSILMNKHFHLVHLDKAVKCDICRRQFINQTMLQRHKRIHTTGKWYPCTQCPKSFNTPSSLKRHITVHDPSLRPLECGVCMQRFIDESTLRKHLLIHAGYRAFVCEICNRAFINRGDLNFHRRIHDPVKPYRCEICGQEFSRHANLMRHLDIHKGNKALHHCHVCGCSYSFISSLTRHIVQKHISNNNNNKQT